ncbi:KLH13-like protein [Mya arenaria]|uniref:KLH13-like protein n=1 Tax=Mya arenaria TaxID=6604 RepID=A0ABY7DUT5_MYAAR|nr:KLH13-like protein [Mya arenaria]
MPRPTPNKKYSTEDFSHIILNQIHEFFTEEQFCDFKIKVHKLVLASVSDYFKAMLSHDMMETRQDCTELKGVSLKGFRPILSYIYQGVLNISLDNAHDVIAGVTFLQIRPAIDLCIKFVKENMTFENAEELLKIGEMFSIPDLRGYYRNYLLRNFLKFVESETFLKIDAESLSNYLSDDALVTTSESILFHHCMRWYNYDPVNREPVAHKVFECIRMCSDGWPLIHYADMQDLFKKNEKCQDVLKFNENYLHNATKRYYLSNCNRTRTRSVRKTIVQIGGVMEADENYDSFQDMLASPSADLCGWNMNHFFHPDLKAWFPLGIVGHWISRLSHQKFVEVNGEGVMVGGYEYHVEGDLVNKIAIADVRMFTAQGNFQFWDMPSLQHPRARHAAVYLNGYIYALGGKDDKQVLRSVERLDCDKETWSYTRPLPYKLYDHAAVVCGGKIYVTGGLQYTVIDPKKTTWCYDPAIDNWKKKADLISARAGHGMASLNDRLYVCGGYNGHRELGNPDGQLRCLVSMEMYNMQANQWTKLAIMKQGICFFEMTAMDNKIIVLGGLDSSGRLTQYMHEYSPTRDKWCVFGEMPRPLKNASCGAVVIKLTDTGCMEDEMDDIKDLYYNIFEEHELASMTEEQKRERERCIRVMENFSPGDYLLDEDSYDEDYPPL